MIQTIHQHLAAQFKLPANKKEVEQPVIKSNPQCNLSILRDAHALEGKQLAPTRIYTSFVKARDS